MIQLDSYPGAKLYHFIEHQVNPAIKNLIRNNKQTLRSYQPPPEAPDNLSDDERRALSQIRQNPNIIIKPADKRSKIVIMDRNQYLTEANRQLSNTEHYQPIQSGIQPQTQAQLRNIIQSLYNKKFITAKQRDHLFGPDQPRPRYFYLLPKIHKDPHTWTIPYTDLRPTIPHYDSFNHNLSLP
ncbi:hypothetical protein FQN60_002450 [Etheostoma spectabile]|uniref:Uncharacterized protein n=1 Tax=Etheostoma spectabile TaxID=54343 RepID=A0A5J5C7S6_9PERO|nr:hypothetical protein FQN60_002450 [Etheostoma spectabile]